MDKSNNNDIIDPEVQTTFHDDDSMTNNGGLCSSSGVGGSSSKKKYLIVGGVALLAIVGTVVGVVMGTSSSGNNSNTANSASSSIESESEENNTNNNNDADDLPEPTQAPTSELYKLLSTVALNGASKDLLDTSTYQHKAYKWLETNTLLNEYTDEQIIQRYSLACLYYSTNGVSNLVIERELPDITSENDIPGWKYTTNWLTDTNECTWYGIICDNERDGNEDDITTAQSRSSSTNNNPDTLQNEYKNEYSSVIEISLYDNRMTGYFAPEISLLHESLETLELGKNEYLVAGTYDEQSTDVANNEWLGELTNLKKLFYPFCKFYSNVGIPNEISKLTKLEEYDCAFNVYQGKLDGDAFKTLTNLVWLDISGGMFNSALPDELLSLPKLEDFFITDSFIIDDISYLTKLSNLYQHVADQNPQLSGELPDAIDMSNDIELLSFSHCNLTGTIPSDYGTTLTELKKFYINNNNLSGEVPSSLGQLSTLTELEIQGNDIVGTMPDEICSNVKPLSSSELHGGTITKLIADCNDDIICPLDTCCTSCGATFGSTNNVDNTP